MIALLVGGLSLVAGVERTARAAESAPSGGTQSSAAPPARPSTTPGGPHDDPDGAKVLFDEAVELARQDKYAEACKKLEASRKLHDGLGATFHLAGCWQKIGRTASAYTLFEEVVQRAHAADQPEREAAARARLDALLPKLSRLKVHVAEPVAGMRVTLDGAQQTDSEWANGIAVDRGEHEVRATADDKVAWSKKLDVSEPSVTIVVEVPPLAAASTPPPTKPAAAEETTPAEPKQDEPSNAQRTVGFVVGGVGVAALAGGIVATATYLHHNNEAKDVCPSNANCSSQDVARHDQAVDDARQARTWAYVGLGVGGAALVTATILLVTAPSHSKPADEKSAASLQLTPTTDGHGSWGCTLLGRF